MSDEFAGFVLDREDVELVKRSLHCYRDMLSRIEDNERTVSPELARVVEMQYRLGTTR
jgi:hypothetical protein